MSRQPTDETIIDVVLDILATEGHDAVRVREVSRRSRVSSRTIYAHFETRDHLIVAALEQWMTANVYLKVAMPEPGETRHDVLMRFLRAQFAPWEENPRMLESYYRARLGPAGARLSAQGTMAARRLVEVFVVDDPQFARDFEEIMRNVSAGLISRFVHGEIGVEEIVPHLELAARRLAAPERIEP
jgi:TetR/AcrR family transcriptional regulator, cholesterol catabolism regulator